MSYDVESYDYSWLNLKKEDIKGIKNPLLNLTDWQQDNFHLHILKIMRNPEYLQWTTKILLGIDLIPIQVVILQELWNNAFPMFLGSRGLGKSFLLAVYATLRCLLIPESKIVIVGAAFRQSKVIFDYMDVIWRNAPILRSLCTEQSGPRRDIDRCTMKINDSWAIAIPLGTGEKIRGLRAHTIISDEFNCLERNTIVQTDEGLVKIKDYLNGNVNRLLNINNEFETPDTIFRTPKVDVYEIVTQNGYSFKCSEKHSTMTTKGWKIAKDLTKNDFLELDNNDYFPARYIDEKGVKVDEKIGWLLGILISEGTCTNRNYISVTNTDKVLIDKIKSSHDYDWKIYEKDAYEDPRGWKCKKSYQINYHNTQFRESLKDLGMDYVSSHNKEIPWCIMQSPREVVIEFLRGIFEGDGSCFSYRVKEKKHVGISYYSVSKDLIDQLQILMLKFGITCTKVHRKSDISRKPQWMLTFRAEAAKMVYDLLKLEKWEKKISGASFFVRKKGIKKKNGRFLCETTRANKNVYLGMSDTVEEAERKFDEYWDSVRPCFRVKSVTKLPDKEVLYDFHLPETHSFYGNGFVQHNSIPVEIYETVVAGFAAVSKDPITNVKEAAKRKKMKEAGVWNEVNEEDYKEQKHENQSILSGTAGYDFEPFAAYWRKYKSIIRHKGDMSKVSAEIASDSDEDDTPDYMKNIDDSKFTVMRIPYELIPEGFMDDQQVSRSRATMHIGTYNQEYGAIFSKDSTGFFKRAMIENCVAKEKNIKKDNWPSWCESPFDVMTRGHSDRKYVFGIDPASEIDNFAIIVMELHSQHQRIVYSWTTNKKDFHARKKLGLTDVSDYYGFCVRKIRDLMLAFPCVRIGIDSQGGGYQIAEGLRDEDKIRREFNEVPIYPAIEEGKEQETDRLPGSHILELINFASAEWTSKANHGLRKDMEDRFTLFPRFDQITLGLITEQDKIRFEKLKNTVGDTSALKLYDTLEDAVMEIEELKAELATIIVSRSSSGRERFDTPEIKLGTGKKGRMRKDRYSALVIANMIVRTIAREIPLPVYSTIGRVADGTGKKEDGSMYMGQDWAKSFDPRSVMIVKRK